MYIKQQSIKKQQQHFTSKNTPNIQKMLPNNQTTLFTSPTTTLTCTHTDGKISLTLQIFSINTQTRTRTANKEDRDKELQRKYHKLIFFGQHLQLRNNFNTVQHIVQHFQNLSNFVIDQQNGDVYLFKNGVQVFVVVMDEVYVRDGGWDDRDVFKPMINKPYYGLNQTTYPQPNKQNKITNRTPTQAIRQQSPQQSGQSLKNQANLTDIEQKINMLEYKLNKRYSKKIEKLQNEIQQLKNDARKRNKIISKLILQSEQFTAMCKNMQNMSNRQNMGNTGNNMIGVDGKMKNGEDGGGGVPVIGLNKSQKSQHQAKMKPELEIQEMRKGSLKNVADWINYEAIQNKIRIKSSKIASIWQQPIIIQTNSPLPNFSYTLTLRLTNIKHNLGLGLTNHPTLTPQNILQQKSKPKMQQKININTKQNNTIMLSTDGTVHYLDTCERNKNVWFLAKNNDMFTMLVNKEKGKVQYLIGEQPVMVIEECEKLMQGDWWPVICMFDKNDCVQFVQY